MPNSELKYVNGHYFTYVICNVFKILFLVILPVSHLEAGKTSKNLAGLWFKSPVIIRDKQAH